MNTEQLYIRSLYIYIHLHLLFKPERSDPVLPPQLDTNTQDSQGSEVHTEWSMTDYGERSTHYTFQVNQIIFTSFIHVLVALKIRAVSAGQQNVSIKSSEHHQVVLLVTSAALKFFRQKQIDVF